MKLPLGRRIVVYWRSRVVWKVVSAHTAWTHASRALRATEEALAEGKRLGTLPESAHIGDFTFESTITCDLTAHKNDTQDPKWAHLMRPRPPEDESDGDHRPPMFQ